MKLREARPTSKRFLAKTLRNKARKEWLRLEFFVAIQ